MRWRNDPTHFGLITKLIHWSMALLIVGLLALGTELSYMRPGLANLWLYGLHKTFGLIALALILIRLIWHRISPPPAPVGAIEHWANRLARAIHALIYGLLILIPLSGWFASSATGIDVMFADTWVVPPIAPVSEALDKAGFLAHWWLTRLLMAALLLHIAGALKRAFSRDGTIRRMTSG